MTKVEAIALYESKFWEAMDFEQRAMFQLWEEKLCMPFGVFHEAISKALRRDVYTHEFASGNNDALKEELLGLRPAPTTEDIINLIPEEKRILVRG